MGNTALRGRQLSLAKSLPECSIPIRVAGNENGDIDLEFADIDSRDWPDQLSRFEQARLVESIPDILDALRSLHDSGIVFGRISNETFRNRGSRSTLSPFIVVDPELAKQACDLMGGHPEEKYWTSDRIYPKRALKPADDLYALGVVLAELALGKNRVDSVWSGVQDNGQFKNKLIEVASKSHVIAPLKKLVIWLLNASESSKAPAATAYLTRVQSQVIWFKRAIASLCLIAMICLIYVWVSSKFSSLKALSDNQSLEISESRSKIDARDNEIKELKSEIELLKADPALPTNTVAKQVWKDKIIAHGSIGDTVKKATGYIKTYPSQPERQQLETWRDQLVQINTQAQFLNVWVKSQPALRHKVYTVINEPWNSSTADAELLSDHVEALNEAYLIWKGWTESNKTFDSLLSEHNLLPAGIAKDVIGPWLRQVRDLNGLHFTFSNGKALTPWSTEHLVSASAGNDSKTYVWNWTDSGASADSVWLNTTHYIPGAPIHVCLEQDGYLNNTNVISETFEGPLAPWKLTAPRPLSDVTSGYSMEIVLGSDIGPPHLSDEHTPTSGSANGTPSGPQPTNPAQPPGYDPTAIINQAAGN